MAGDCHVAVVDLQKFCGVISAASVEVPAQAHQTDQYVSRPLKTGGGHEGLRHVGHPRRVAQRLAAAPARATAPSITVTGGDHAITIADGTSMVRLVLTKRGTVCPRCGSECFYLLYRAQWCCRSCSGCDYRIRHCYRSTSVLRRLAILRSLARAPVLSLKAQELRFRLDRVNREIAAHVRRSVVRADRRKRQRT